ncbi:phage baseplate assembly protein V [Yersinia bercovieri]|uniref:phage baseplate assembly protein V n=1 Tax=Yersinia bercovieri TaxID=634 RepID=UPI0021BDB9C1|nr:phage baseplate assembly protein V [Yersinia bercovieri]
MNTQTQLTEILRLLRNLIRIGTVAEVDLDQALCRVATGDNTTGWLNWLTLRAGQSRSWWAPSEGEQVLILSLGGELDTAFVLPGIFSDDFPPPSASADGLYIAFPDGATLHYEPDSGELLADGIKTAVINASESVNATAPNITCKFSIQLAKGRADLYPEVPIKVTGFKKQIDEADWTLVTVTHSVSDTGFTTALELEVKIDDLDLE